MRCSMQRYRHSAEPGKLACGQTRPYCSQYLCSQSLLTLVTQSAAPKGAAETQVRQAPSCQKPAAGAICQKSSILCCSTLPCSPESLSTLLWLLAKVQHASLLGHDSGRSLSLLRLFAVSYSSWSSERVVEFSRLRLRWRPPGPLCGDSSPVGKDEAP